MRDSLIILIFFVMGIILAYTGMIPAIFLEGDLTLHALWLLMALVGLSLGADKRLAQIIRTLRLPVLLPPLATTIGTFMGAIAASFLLALGMADCLAVASGFAYYSLSSIFITEYKGPDLGAMALICNISRELFTLLLTPILVRFFGPLAAITSGGATTMDTTLPIITLASGRQWILPAITHAVIIDFSVPFWVTLFCAL